MCKSLVCYSCGTSIQMVYSAINKEGLTEEQKAKIFEDYNIVRYCCKTAISTNMTSQIHHDETLKTIRP